MHSPTRNRIGFTLIELLATIGIIAVLVALTVPALSKIRRKGQITTSLANLRQIGVASVGYVNDNEQNYPRVSEPGGSMWINKLWAYTYPQRVFPGWGNEIRGTIYHSPLQEPGAAARSYGMNLRLEEKIRGETGSTRYRFLANSSQTALVGDTKTTSSLKEDQVNFRNNGTINVLFLDGHVESMTPGSIPSDLDTPFWTGVPAPVP